MTPYTSCCEIELRADAVRHTFATHFHQSGEAARPQGYCLIATGGKFDIDLTTQVKFDRDMFRLTVDGVAVTLTLSPVARHRLEWRCDACEVPCEHAGAAFSLILKEKLALGLAGAPPARAPVESVSEEALVAQALAKRAERARTRKCGSRLSTVRRSGPTTH